MESIDEKLDKSMRAIYDVRMLCYDILKELKSLKLNKKSVIPGVIEQGHE